MDSTGLIRRPRRVVVVGAGICGCNAAATLRRRWGPGIEIEVFDRGPVAGGRVARRHVAGIDVETGASLFHSSNQLLVQTAREFGLTIVEAAAGPESVGIWDGQRVRVRTRGADGMDRLRLLGRYRLSLVRVSRVVERMVTSLGGVYARLSRGDWWPGPKQMLDALSLAELSGELAQDHLRRRGVGSRFVGEFADGVSRNNYGQDSTELNALAELVSLAGAGLGGGSLHRIGEGNYRVCEGLLQSAGARLRPNATVRRIHREGPDWLVSGEAFETVRADVVVLAAPQELASVQLPTGTTVADDRQYKTIHATFVTAVSRPGSVGAGTPPEFVLTTNAVSDFYSVQRITDYADGALYKIFSPEEIPGRLLDRLFSRVDDVVSVVWSAYPLLTPVRSWPSFRIAQGLYYPSAMECAVSTMETQAIAGAAAANLAAHDTTPLH